MTRTTAGLSSRRRFAAGVATTGLLVSMACIDGPSQVEFIDLVGENRFEADGDRVKAGETFAADETWVAVEVDAGRPITADVKLQSNAILEFAGTFVCRDGSAPDESLELLVDVKGGAGANLRRSFAVDGTGTWWSHRLDLGGLGRRRIELVFEAQAPRDCRMLLRKATIRQTTLGQPRTTVSPPQILLVSVDTLRKDAIGAFGGSTETPSLDRFAAEAQRWTRHYAAATWTKPSHASMLTGYHVDTHRAIHLHQAMDPAIPTLAERFQSGGLLTAALVYDCGWLSRKWGFGKGFDDYRLTQWRAGRQATAAAQWVIRHRNEPFFYFVHTFEPHSDSRVLPYEAPGVNRRTIAEEFGVENFGRRQGRSASQFLVALDRGEVPRQPGDVEILRATYAAGVRYLDASLGVLFDALRESGVWDQLLVVVTSDHGEEFDEHGGFEHGSLYEEIIAVPLMIKWPRSERAGEVTDVLSSSVDLAPTLLEYVGLPAADLAGVNLETRSAERPVFAGTTKRAVISGHLKASFDGSGPLLLFDLFSDPGEVRNILDADPAAAGELAELLREQRLQAQKLYLRLGSQQENPDVDLSEAERERLKAFGYLDN